MGTLAKSHSWGRARKSIEQCVQRPEFDRARPDHHAGHRGSTVGPQRHAGACAGEGRRVEGNVVRGGHDNLLNSQLRSVSDAIGRGFSRCRFKRRRRGRRPDGGVAVGILLLIAGDKTARAVLEAEAEAGRYLAALPMSFEGGLPIARGDYPALELLLGRLPTESEAIAFCDIKRREIEERFEPLIEYAYRCGTSLEAYHAGMGPYLAFAELGEWRFLRAIWRLLTGKPALANADRTELRRRRAR